MSNAAFPTLINLIRAHSMIEERVSGELAAIHGLALNEALLLMHLERAPLHRLTRVDLAKRLHLNPSTVTRMAAPLEKTGLALVGEVRATLEKRAQGFFRDRWSEAEITQLSSLLGRLVASEPGDLVG